WPLVCGGASRCRRRGGRATGPGDRRPPSRARRAHSRRTTAGRARAEPSRSTTPPTGPGSSRPGQRAVRSWVHRAARPAVRHRPIRRGLRPTGQTDSRRTGSSHTASGDTIAGRTTAGAGRCHTEAVHRPPGRALRALLAAFSVVAIGACTPEPDADWMPPPTEAPISTSPTPAPVFVGWSDPSKVGQPYGDKVAGLLTFRGNPTRTYYGTGPVPRVTPSKLWRFPKSGGMCAESRDERGVRLWCGSGWTGQPAVFEREGRTWVVFGAYDRKVHFLHAQTGERILSDFPTGDIIKGSVTVDPDGYPLVYTGSRDNYFRIIAIDRDR